MSRDRYVSPDPKQAATDDLTDARAAHRRLRWAWAGITAALLAYAAIPGSGVWFAITMFAVIDESARKGVALGWILFGAVVATFLGGITLDRRHRPRGLRSSADEVLDAQRRLRDMKATEPSLADQLAPKPTP